MNIKRQNGKRLFQESPIGEPGECSSSPDAPLGREFCAPVLESFPLKPNLTTEHRASSSDDLASVMKVSNRISTPTRTVAKSSSGFDGEQDGDKYAGQESRTSLGFCPYRSALFQLRA